MYILSAASAHPDTLISDIFLAELSPEFAASSIRELTGINSRYSVLDPTYLRESKNLSPAAAIMASKIASTELAAQASKKALELAKIKPEQVGLVIGDCSVPSQTIPAESQRIAKLLGVKAPSFDIICGSASMHVALETLNSWKDDQVPDYVLVVSSNVPTQRVNFERGRARLWCGDGASAIVVSTRAKGPLKILSSKYSATPGMQNSLTSVPLFDHLEFAPTDPEMATRADLDTLRIGLRSLERVTTSLRWIPTQIGTQRLKSSCADYGLFAGQIWSVEDRFGFMFGSSFAACLSEHWKSIVTERLVILATAVTPWGGRAVSVLESGHS